MDLLFELIVNKKETKNSNSNDCHVTLMEENDTLVLTSQFNIHFNRQGVNKHLSYVHSLSLNLNNADFKVSYSIKNSNIDTPTFRDEHNEKKNNFNMLFEFTENGFYKGEKSNGYWGVKYYRDLSKIVQIIYDKIKPRIKSEYTLEKLCVPEKVYFNELYDLIVDFHLDNRGIKGHDSVYQDIIYEYPKKKWLVKNEYKFLPAVLDSYGIKSKYLISELNSKWSKTIHISSLNYICKLFGKNYISYLKRFAWELLCYDLPPNKKTHELRNDSEKEIVIKLISNWEKEIMKSDSFIYSMNKLLSLREFLDGKGYELKFNAKNDSDFENLLEMWSGHKIHLTRGYKFRYVFPIEFIKTIEEEITIDDMMYKPKIIMSEDDFRTEGHSMKNCMSQQFPHGVLSIYISLSYGRKKINLQYRKGLMVQSYGKANTKVPELFTKGIEILNERMSKFNDVIWIKEKFDYINN